MSNSSLEGQTTETHYCLEMFTRALHGDQHAQMWFQRRFRHTLLARLKGHPSRAAVCTIYSEARLLEKTFQYLWHTQIDSLQDELSATTTIKHYVYASLNRVMLETLRSMKAANMPAPPASLRQDPAHGTAAEGQTLWQRIEELFPDERERRLAYLLFSCDLKPSDIVRTFPQEFNDIHEIARLRLTIMEQLCAERDRS